MYSNMRRQERQLGTPEGIDVLEKGEYGVLSTLDSEGNPYGVPLNYVYSDECIYFHCALEGQKIDNIKNDSRVSFCVVGNTQVVPEKFTSHYVSVIIFGKAAEMHEEEKENALMALIEKYSSDYIGAGRQYAKKALKKTGVYKIKIEHFTAKANPKRD
ncbi:MAG: pyridoxamine 5'-phosphate oxidase family protein [Bacillota bacterium]|nr:pyridoxamine 5'-phosphate oxidase family protein [Bacillota bacterium]